MWGEMWEWGAWGGVWGGTGIWGTATHTCAHSVPTMSPYPPHNPLKSPLMSPHTPHIPL